MPTASQNRLDNSSGGADAGTRAQNDPYLEAVRDVRAAKTRLTELSESLEREPRPCGFLKVMVDETGAVELESSTHLLSLLLKILDGKCKSMKPLASIKTFHDDKVDHWLDEFDGDPSVDAKIGAFSVETVFTLDPARLHLAIDALEKAFDRVLKVYELFSLVEAASLN